MCFFCRHVRTVILMTMQPISDDMVTTSKVCVIVAKRERTLISTLNMRNIAEFRRNFPSMNDVTFAELNAVIAKKNQ